MCKAADELLALVTPRFKEALYGFMCPSCPRLWYPILFIYLSICSCSPPSLPPSVHPSIPRSIHPSIHPAIQPSSHPAIHSAIQAFMTSLSANHFYAHVPANKMHSNMRTVCMPYADTGHAYMLSMCNVCMYACMYVIHACMYVCMYVFMYVCTEA